MIIEDYIKIGIALDGVDEVSVKELLPLYKDLPYTEVVKLFNEYQELDDLELDLINRFTIGGVEFGLIPDFDKMSTGEFIDISSYETGVGNIHRLMAVLYRPVIKSRGKKYNIEMYRGSDEYKDIMLKVDVKVYLSVISFFFYLSKACMKVFHTSIQNELNRKEVVD